jgi:hypothetical protein
MGLLCLTMAAVPAAAQDADAVEPPATADAPADQPAAITTRSGTVGVPPAGKAEIIFWRPGTVIGAGLGCTVHEGAAEVARLGAGKYWVEIVDPGKHVYFTQGEVKDTLPMEAEEGETYFVRCAIGMGIVAGRPQISPSDRAEFAKRAKGMTLWARKATS